MTNRILWNQRPTDGRDVDAAGDIDEIVLHDIRTLHIEQVDGRCWWIGVYPDDGEAYWMGNFVADSRGRMRFTQQENNGIVWEIDQTHEVPDNDERPSPGEGRGAFELQGSDE